MNFWIEALVGFISAVVALLVYLHSRQKQRDSFLEKLTEAYDAFWCDPEMREVRAWIANDDAFDEVRTVFAKRRAQEESADAPGLTRDEYVQIDKLDKFCGLMTRMVALHVEFRHRRDIWASELWEYWLRAWFQPGSRPDVAWYMRRYWTELAKVGEAPYEAGRS